MANLSETTFGNLQIDERFKKLERSLKLALLKKEYGRNISTGEVSSMTTWPSISSINVDTLDSSCVTPSLQPSLIKSEVLTSSNNLRNILLKKKSRNNQEAMATSSIKKYSVKQDSHIDQLAMPPPIGNAVYRNCKEKNRVCTPLNCEKAASTLLNSSVQSFPVNFQTSTSSCISANTNITKEYLHSFVRPMTSVNDCQSVDRVFSKWRVMLNDHYELLIKGTLECGRLARSKPVIRRYTSTCVESKYKHRYSLQGNIVDEKNVLPDYIRGKFYNGFPDDWENVYQIWRTYISQGSPLMFRWPTPITDSDDDLKSELTDFTYTKNDKIIPLKETYESIEHTKIFENSNNKSLKEKEKFHNCSSHGLQSYAKNTSINPFISNSKNIISVAQTKNMKSTYEEDNEQDVKSNVNILCNSKKMDKLQDILQEDKLNTIINNLADRNCSPKYIDKIIEMFNCLDYIMSYRTESECNYDSVISASCTTQKSIPIPLQQTLTTCNDNHVNSDKLGNKSIKLKNYMYSSNLGYDLGYGSIKNDSKPQLSNLINIESEHENDKDSEKSESETYAGIPKISMERILKIRETSKKIYRRKVTNKNYTNAQKSAVNSQYKAKGIENEFESLHATIPINNNIEKNLSSCVSLTEDEVKTTNTKLCHKTNIEKPQEVTFSNHQGRNNLDVHRGKKLIIPTIDIKKNLPLDESCVSITEDEVEVTNMKKCHKTTNITQRPQEMTLSNQKIERKNIFDVYGENKPVKRVQNEQPPDASELSNIPTKNEIPTQRSKPTIISSMPVNLNLRIHNVPKPRQSHVSDVSIIENEDKQCVNIQLSQEIHNKKSVMKATVPNQCLSIPAAIPVAIANDSKATTEIHPITNNKSKSNIGRTNSTKLMTVPILGQSKSSKPKVENNTKVLTAWMPKVVYYAKSKFESGLIFEGKLLNEAGHVIRRKFTTDIVLKRLSATLIETVNHECYRLLGHLNDNKRIIPKELAIQCRNGCPVKIEQFCLTWKKLQQGQVQKIEEKLHNASMDSLSAPVSSRGRRILPPLCYWEGERITLKDNIPIYSPGNSQKSSLTSLTENLKKKLDVEEKTKQKEDSKNISKKQTINKQKLLSESNETFGTNRNQTIIIEKTRSPNKSPKGKAASSIRRSDNSKKSQKSTINSKRQVRQQLIFSSSDSYEEKQKTFAQKRARRSQSITNVDAEVPSRYTLRKRQKVEVLPNKTLHRNAKHYTAYYSPTKKSDMTCAYFRRDPLLEDFLSENELSIA